MHPGGPAWTALASEEISEYRKARDPYTPIPLVRMLRWLRRVGSRFARYRIVRRRFVQYTIVRRRFVLCIPIRCGRVRGRACRPVTLSAIAELPDPETPEGECRAGEDDHRCPHVEAKPQDDVGVVIAQHLDEQAAGRVEHAVERKDLAPGKGEAAVDQHERQGHEQAPQRLVEKRRLAAASGGRGYGGGARRRRAPPGAPPGARSWVCRRSKRALVVFCPDSSV